MIFNHLHTSDEKLKWWGYGEWIEEPDEVLFEHDEIKCRVLRIMVKVNWGNDHVFGGHLCGYIMVPDHSIYFLKSFEEIDIEAHGGLTYGEIENDGCYWIGFDCGHAFDHVPSYEKVINHHPNLQSIREDIDDLKRRFPSCANLLKPTYKNINFAIRECKRMAEQLNALEKENVCH